MRDEFSVPSPELKRTDFLEGEKKERGGGGENAVPNMLLL